MLGRYRLACFFLKASHALLVETLNAKKYPLITFKSQGIIKKDNQFEATGKLALRGTTKIITRPFTGNKSTVIFNGNFAINPNDYDSTRKDTPQQINVMLSVPVMQ